MIVSSMPLNSGFEVIAGFFDIVHFRNTGAAFSLFSEGGVLKSVFLVLTSVAALVIIAFLIKDEKRRLSVIAFSLIAGGAAGNLIDRVRLGYVVDFLFFSIAGYHWPAFNVADSAITIGAAMAAYLKNLKMPEIDQSAISMRTSFHFYKPAGRQVKTDRREQNKETGCQLKIPVKTPWHKKNTPTTYSYDPAHPKSRYS